MGCCGSRANPKRPSAKKAAKKVPAKKVAKRGKLKDTVKDVERSRNLRRINTRKATASANRRAKCRACGKGK